MCTETDQPVDLGVDVIGMKIKVHSILDHFRLRHPLEPQSRRIRGSLDQNGRIVLWIINTDRAQSRQLVGVVGRNGVPVEGCGPEPGDDGWARAIDHNISETSHHSSFVRERLARRRQYRRITGELHTSLSCSQCGSVDALLEPVVGVWLVVERLDFPVAGCSVHRDRLGEGLVRFESYRSAAAGDGSLFEFIEQASANAETSRSWVDPHPLELGWCVGVELECATSDRIAMRCGDEEGARRGSHLVEVGRDASRRIEARIESVVKLGEVLGEAMLGVGVSRIDAIDLDERGGEQPVDFVHRRNEAPTLGVVQPFEHRQSEGIAASVEQVDRSAEPFLVSRAVRTCRLCPLGPTSIKARASNERSRRLR